MSRLISCYLTILCSRNFIGAMGAGIDGLGGGCG